MLQSPTRCSLPRLLVVAARRVDLAAARETSGTATSHQKPPASVDPTGSVSMTMTWVVFAARAVLNAVFELGDRRDLDRLGAERARMGDEVDLRQRLVPRVAQEIVERRAAGRLLQPVDAAEAAIVEHDDDELLAEHHRGRDLGIHHQIGAVADHHDHFAVRQRHLDADPAGDLVAHAGIAVFEVVAERRARPPQLVQFARQSARGADDDVALLARAHAARRSPAASVGAGALVGAV